MEATTRMTDRRQTGLLSSAVAGDEVAFRKIIATYHDDMRRVARYIARDGTLAEEATQAAWVIAWKKLGNVNGDRPVGRAGPARHGENPRLAGQLGFGQRHEPGARFMPAHNGLNRVGIMQRIKQGKVAFARHAIDPVNAVGLQPPYDEVGNSG